MTVRPAVEGDLSAIQQIGRETWPATYGFAGADYVANGLATWWSDDALQRSLRDTIMLVAIDGDQAVGVGNLDIRGEVPIIWKLYVRPGTQGAGVGSALLAALIEQAPPGSPAVRLEYVDGNERAAGFYAAHGFVELRREPGEQPGWPDTVWVERPLP